MSLQELTEHPGEPPKLQVTQTQHGAPDPEELLAGVKTALHIG